jgi:hypothetical protein
VEQNRSYIEHIFCGLQHFDLILEMDEVLEFVSPDIFGVEWLDKTTSVICTRIHQCTFTTWLPTHRQGFESNLREGTRLEGILGYGCTG